MGLRRLINLLLAIALIAGLAVAPWGVGPAAAKQVHAAAMASMDMASMPGDMPCCPDKQKNGDCEDCPLIALCMLKAAQVDRSGGVMLVRAPVRIALSAFDDVLREGPDRPPPDHPPRSLV